MKAVVGVVAALMLFGWLFGDGDSGGSGSGSDSAVDEFDAQVMCERFIEDRLKSPSSADFSDQKAWSTGGSKWSVTGTVDAENSFGAMLRAEYYCDLKYLGDDEWRLLSGDILE